MLRGDRSEERGPQCARGRRAAYSPDPDQESFSEEQTFELTPEKTETGKKKRKRTGRRASISSAGDSKCEDLEERKFCRKE